jgi:hypothetical protein
MANSFLRLQQVYPGFDETKVETINIAIPTSKYRPEQV